MIEPLYQCAFGKMLVFIFSLWQVKAPWFVPVGLASLALYILLHVNEIRAYP